MESFIFCAVIAKHFFIILKQHQLSTYQKFGSKKFGGIAFLRLRIEQAAAIVKITVDVLIFLLL